MIYRKIALVMFSLFLGWNMSSAQVEPCESLEEVKAAVAEVMATSGCDEAMSWEAPNALNVHLKKLENWCGEQQKPLKSKIPNIIQGMLETIQDAYEGETYFDPITGLDVVVTMPAPECALEALAALEEILLGIQ